MVQTTSTLARALTLSSERTWATQELILCCFAAFSSLFCCPAFPSPLLSTEVDPLLAASECSLLNDAIPTDIALLIRLGFLGSFFLVLSVALGESCYKETALVSYKHLCK